MGVLYAPLSEVTRRDRLGLMSFPCLFIAFAAINRVSVLLELELDASVNPSHPTDGIGEES